MLNTQPGSPEWWRLKMSDALDAQCKQVATLEKYNDGEHPLPTPPQAMNAAVYEEAKQAFSALSKLGRTNLMPLVAKAPADRLSVTGFRFGESTTGNDEAWRIWQRNHMDADHRLLIDTALVCRNSYALVWPDDDGLAEITCEHPSQMIVAYAAGSRRKRVAAFKRWTADDGRLMATLYMPDFLYKWQTASTRPGYGAATGGATWQERHVVGEEWPLPNPFEKVPVVELAVNTGLKARPFGGGVGEFERVLTIQDRINKGVFDRLVTAEYQAFRQRYSIGYTPPVDPETAQPDPRAAFRSSQSRMSNFPKGTTVGEFGQADFTGFMKSFESDVSILATASMTPQSYLPLDLKNLGAETIVQTNIGFVAKTQRHQSGFSESLEEIIRLALEVENNPLSSDDQSQVLWKSIEVQTLAEIGDFIVKMKDFVPDEVLWSMLPGVGQQDINMWRSQRAAASLFGQPTPPPGGVGGAP